MKQVLIPLYNTEDGISTGEFGEILHCNRNTARRILLELQKEGLVSETGIQTQVCFGKTKQSVTQKQEGLRNNLNPWKITEAGKKYVDTVSAPVESEPELELSQMDKNRLHYLFFGERYNAGHFEKWGELFDKGLVVFKTDIDDDDEVILTPVGRAYVQKLIDEVIKANEDKYANILMDATKDLIRLFNGEKIPVIAFSHSYHMQSMGYVTFPYFEGRNNPYKTYVELTPMGRRRAEGLVASQPKPIIITVDMLMIDELDDKPTLRFAHENGDGWIGIEECNSERDVMLVFHTDSTAPLDFTALIESPILDGTRSLRVNRKVAYAFFKMIQEKPVCIGCSLREGSE